LQHAACADPTTRSTREAIFSAWSIAAGFVHWRATDLCRIARKIEAAQPKLDLGVLKDLSSKKIMLGVLDLADPTIESVDTVADRIRNGLKYVSPDRLVAAPDCGMKYMPPATAFGKLKAMIDAAAKVAGRSANGL
jgi:methionine synthase II (cobalamin-independent)